MSKLIRRVCTPLGLSVALMLTACGGDGGGKDDPATAQTLSGTAAAGAPLAGTVTVQDAAGTTRTTPIGANGQYSIDVSGLTPPFVLRATGNIGGRTYVIHSAAVSTDVGGTINITPLTDLIVANVAGEIASEYFRRGNFSGLSKEELAAESAKLKEKLQPLLDELQVGAGIDLLRTPFTPLASALDTALDQIRISVDQGTNIATIRNVITQQELQDDLAVKAAQETSPQTMDDVSNVGSTVNDIPKIREALLGFSSKFATGLPASGVLAPYLTDDFLDHDRSKADFLNEAITYTDLIGTQFTNVEIDAIDYSDSSRVTAKVRFDIVDGAGRINEAGVEFRLRKSLNGTWLLHGDQRILDIEGQVLAFSGSYSNASGGGTPNACRSSGFTFWIEDMDDSNNGGNIAYIKVEGPGLPEAGLRFNAPSTGGNWHLPGNEEGGADGGNFHILTSSCQTPLLSDESIAGLASDASYTLTAYTEANVKVPLGDDASGSYQVRVRSKPLTRTELIAATFPSFSSPASFAAFAAYQGGDLALVVSGLTPYKPGWLYLYGQTGAGQSESVDKEFVPADGSFSTTFTLNLQSVQGKTLRVSTQDATGRSFVTAYDHYPAPAVVLP